MGIGKIIAGDRIIPIQKHDTPLFTTESFKYRNEVIATDDGNNTCHTGSYLGDRSHEGAIASVFQVAKLVGVEQFAMK